MKLIKKIYRNMGNSYIACIGFCVIFFLVTLSFSFCRDTDLLWHIKTGERIFAEKAVVLSDSFSWQTGLMWYQQAWLFDCFIYLVTLLPDICFELLFIINSIAMIMFGMVHCKPSSKISYTVFALIYFIVIPANHGNRSSEFSVWIVLGILYLLMSGLSMLKKCGYMFLFGILVANFHAAVIFPLFGFGAVLLLCEIVLCFRSIGEKRRLISIPLSYIFFVCGTFIGPCGVKLYSYLSFATNTESTEYLGEWLPWTPGIAGFLIIVVSLASIFFSLPAIWNDSKKLRAIFVWFGGFGLTFMYGAKGGIFLLLFSFFILYPYIELLLCYCIPNRRMLKKYGVFVVYSISIGYAFILSGVGYKPFLERSDNFIPAIIQEELRRGYEEQGEDFRVFGPYTLGNYLLWNNIPCFIDSRQVLYISEVEGDGSLDDYLQLLYADRFSLSLYNDFFEKYDFTYVLDAEEFRLTEYLDYCGDYECIIDVSDMKLWKKKDS